MGRVTFVSMFFEDVSSLDLGGTGTRAGKRAKREAPSFGFAATQVPSDVKPVEKKVRPKPEVPVTRDEWLQRLVVTPEEAARIVAYEQGTERWLQSRVGRITSSNFGAACGLNKHSSPRALVKQMLWGEFKGNVATRWGSDHEDVARDEYLAVRRAELPFAFGDEYDLVIAIDVEECGLVINPERAWMGNSPDGIITLTRQSGAQEKGLLEIKCPFAKKFYRPDPVPIYYKAQVQGTMGNMGLPWCDFVVWTPTGMEVTHMPFEKEFWDGVLLPGVTSFYFDRYLPLALRKENGELEEGCVE